MPGKWPAAVHNLLRAIADEEIQSCNRGSIEDIEFIKSSMVENKAVITYPYLGRVYYDPNNYDDSIEILEKAKLQLQIEFHNLEPYSKKQLFFQ